VIGVVAKPNEVPAVKEFFQLFKTSWEFYDARRSYDLVIATATEIPQDLNARALIVYQSLAIKWDDHFDVVTESRTKGGWVEWQGGAFPVYGDLAVFRPLGRTVLKRNQSDEIVGSTVDGSHHPAVRIGIDLFYEVAFLLTEGQPAENARLATLDIHISLLRAIMVSLGIPFIEVMPVPAGYDFVGCLTHDVDFVGIRDHKGDLTMWGFLFRASVGSLLKALERRLSWSRCLQNWMAALSLPLVHVGLRDDFWLEFDRYMELERELGSTFFFLPFKKLAGTLGSVSAPKRRAAKYELDGIKEQVLKLAHSGCEVGLHGIDAWQDVQRGKAEQSRIRETTGQLHVGVRMHWLYWDKGSAKKLDEAGFTYDSTFGYNDAVGFRPGTTQPFRPLDTETLLELPLNIQDSAMFYPDRMALSETEALEACRNLIQSMSSSGGVLTLNWHTRSLSPERLWGHFYATLLKEIQRHRVWFGTAQEIVAWFRKRRALRFDGETLHGNGVRVALNVPTGSPEPAFTVRIHYPRLDFCESGFPVWMPAHTDFQWNGEDALEIPYRRLIGPCTSVFAPDLSII
jgi:hypothetical protein